MSDEGGMRAQVPRGRPDGGWTMGASRGATTRPWGPLRSATQGELDNDVLELARDAHLVPPRREIAIG